MFKSFPDNLHCFMGSSQNQGKVNPSQLNFALKKAREASNSNFHLNALQRRFARNPGNRSMIEGNTTTSPGSPRPDAGKRFPAAKCSLKIMSWFSTHTQAPLSSMTLFRQKAALFRPICCTTQKRTRSSLIFRTQTMRKSLRISHLTRLSTCDFWSSVKKARSAVVQAAGFSLVRGLQRSKAPGVFRCLGSIPCSSTSSPRIRIGCFFRVSSSSITS